jgi:eukaryotic-like serine/threonine-protein kinase
LGPESAAAPGNLTAPGTLLGTPYYMAPELYDGAEASARSDQFSFCVGLYTALYGERPFEDDDLPPGRAARSGRLRPPRTRSRVSPRIRAAIERGLSADPAARFPSLDGLLAELSPPPYRRARGMLAVGAALAIVAWLVARPSELPDQRCTGAGAAFATAWNAERRGAIGVAFTASRAPDAAAALERVAGVLDQYAARWTQAHTDACRATRILGEQTDAMLALRMTCLERRRQEVAALVDALAAANDRIVVRSMEAAVQLADVAICADTAELGQIAALPADLASRAKLADLTSRLADASARYHTGALTPALELARPIAAEAHTLGYLPFQAEAELLQGSLEYDLGDLEHAEVTLHDAVWAAEAGRHDLVTGRAWIKLMTLIGLTKDEFARGLALAPRVTAAIKRVNGDAQMEADLERALSGIDLEQRKLRSALSHSESALAIAERKFGAEHLNVGKLQEAVGIVLLEQGQLERAMQSLQRALQIYERTLGPDHPSIGRIVHNLGIAHLKAREAAVAERELRRALAIREAAQGPQHPSLPPLLTDLGRALSLQGRVEEALSYDRRALVIAEKAFAPEHLAVGGSLFELGINLGATGHYREADDLLRRAQAIVTRMLGRDHVRVMDTLIARGDLLMLQSRWRDAAALYEHALPVVEQSEGTGDEIRDAASQLSRAYVELHEPARARALLERLASTLNDQPPDIRATVDFTLARALWDTGGDRARAHELASRALAGIRGVVTARREDVAQIERWLARHPVTARKPP